jgi:hypothetical protein
MGYSNELKCLEQACAIEDLLWQKLTCLQIPKVIPNDEEKRLWNHYKFISNPLFLFGWIQMQIGFFSSSSLRLIFKRFEMSKTTRKSIKLKYWTGISAGKIYQKLWNFPWTFFSGFSTSHLYSGIRKMGKHRAVGLLLLWLIWERPCEKMKYWNLIRRRLRKNWIIYSINRLEREKRRNDIIILIMWNTLNEIKIKTLVFGNWIEAKRNFQSRNLELTFKRNEGKLQRVMREKSLSKLLKGLKRDLLNLIKPIKLACCALWWHGYENFSI